MKSCKIVSALFSGILFALVCSLFATSAFAQSDREGIDIRIGFGAGLYREFDTIEIKTAGIRSREKFEFDDPLSLNGMALDFSFGYRWRYVGVALDVDFAFVKWDRYIPRMRLTVEEGGYKSTTSTKRIKYREGEGSSTNGLNNDDFYFLGGTYALVRGIIPATPQFQIDLGLGLGVMYSDGDSKGDGTKRNHKSPLVRDTEGDKTAYFAIKLVLGLTYYFTDNFGLGLFSNLHVGSYDDSFKSDTDEGLIKTSLDCTIILYDVGLQGVIRF